MRSGFHRAAGRCEATMPSPSPARRGTTYGKAIALVLIPEFLYYITIFALVVVYGGHRVGYVGDNPSCASAESAHAHAGGGAGARVVMHITDLHVSTESQGCRERLHKFEHDTFPGWAPILSGVVVSGDLVHAIAPRTRFLGSRSLQSNAEWGEVSNFLARVNATAPLVVCHGNHDSFGASVQVRAYPKVSASEIASPVRQDDGVRVLRLPDKKLAIIALDATLERPIHRPINFFGDGKRVLYGLRKALDWMPSDYDVVVFSHYPSGVLAGGRLVHKSAIPRTGTGTNTAAKFAAYLSGHLHDLHGVAKHGLALTAHSGVMELETPDMARAGAYRIVVIEDGIVSTMVSFVNATDDEFLHDVVVLNPPRAGLCSPGAGHRALTSTHIRVLSARVDLENDGVRAFVNGEFLGTFEKLGGTGTDADCSTPACAHIYGVIWDASRYAHGVHQLVLKGADTQSWTYYFSLAGKVNEHGRIQRWISSFFSLTDFEFVMGSLTTTGLALSAGLTISGVVKRHRPSLVLFGFALFWLLGGPIIIGKRLIAENEDAIAWISLQSITVLGVGTWKSGVDIGFLFARNILWPVLVPLCYTQALLLNGCRMLVGRIELRRVLTVMGFLYSWRCLGVCREIAGAYGLYALLMSPSCVVMMVGTVLCMRCVVAELGRHKHHQCTDSYLS